VILVDGIFLIYAHVGSFTQHSYCAAGVPTRSWHRRSGPHAQCSLWLSQCHDSWTMIGTRCDLVAFRGSTEASLFALAPPIVGQASLRLLHRIEHRFCRRFLMARGVRVVLVG
jgi:hypothetical protein